MWIRGRTRAPSDPLWSSTGARPRSSMTTTSWGEDRSAVYEGSTPLIQANRLAGGPRIYGEFGDAAVVRGNSITDTPRRSGIILWEGAHALMEDNIITDAGCEGIGVRRGAPTIRGNTIARTRANGIEVRQADAGPLIVGNIIVDAGQIGINLVAGAARVEGNTVERAGSTAISVRGSTLLDARPAVIGNVLRQDAVAITWGAPAGTVADNEVYGGGEGILVGLGSPLVTGNRIVGVERRGLFVGRQASPTLAGNTSCRNGEDLVVEDGSNVTGEETTRTCESTTASPR